MADVYVTEKNYLVAEGGEGELYVFLQAKKDNPEKPRIIYDGKDHAIFMRSPTQKIILDYIHPDIRDKLRKAEQVVIVETLLENISSSYIADMQMIDHIPLDWDKIGLKTWEAVALSK